MAGKNINVKLTFQADASAAKREMASLQQNLSNLAATNTTKLISPKAKQDLTDAKNKAIELKIALNNATNVKTGKLNFTKFSQELKQSKMTVQDFGAALAKLGPEGSEAMLQLSRAIRTAETPIVSLKGKVAALADTLTNTIRWQISSSITQGAVSAFSSVIDYAKELNESLNNIRIVTNKSEIEMSKFAKSANKAAKALSTTTKEYTDASLIYFQQGLNGKEVEERTNTTIKLANVVGESAETVSEWMTAIWNNFDNGSKSLEYYADVLAELGAATASSADEIAGGLEKFASVADSVGLSYEYAASMIATITSATRQSEDVVGTALKTILARVEDLDLGKTLEDGTSMGQYSAALASVGVNIKDASGNLREMDDILDDIGDTWQLLNRDQQVALAQSVAGIRQYSQFIALMDNWDAMEKNVELSKEANGELEQQNLIFSQGIEGTTERINAELEKIKNTILDENDLLPLLNMAEGFLSVVSNLIESLGGLPTLLTIISSIMLRIYGPKVTQGLRDIHSFVTGIFSTLSGKAARQQKANLEAAVQSAVNIAERNTEYGSEEQSARVSTIRQQSRIEEELGANKYDITPKAYQDLEIKGQLVKKTGEEYIEKSQIYDKNMAATDKMQSGTAADLNIDNSIFEELDKITEWQSDAQSLKGRTMTGSKEDRDYTFDAIKSIYNEAGMKMHWTQDKSATSKMEKLDTRDALQAERDALKTEKDKEEFDKSKKGQELKGLNEEAAAIKQALSDLFQDLITKADNFGDKKIQETTEKTRTSEIDSFVEEDKSLKRQGSLSEDIYSRLSEEDKETVKDKKADFDQKLNDANVAKKAVNDTNKKIKAVDSDANLSEKQRQKALKKLNKELKINKEAEKEANEELKKSKKDYADAVKGCDSYKKAQDEAAEFGEELEEQTKKNVKALADEKKAKEANADANKNFSDSLEKAKDAGKGIAQHFTDVATLAMGVVSGFQMISSAWDNLTTSLSEGDFGGVISSIMTMTMGFMQLGDAIADSSKKGIIHTIVSKLMGKASKKAAQDNKEATDQEIKDDNRKQASSIKTAMTKVAEWFGKGPWGWVIAAASLAAIVALLASVGAQAKSVSAANAQKADDTNEEAQAAKEEADKNKELIDSYSNLYDTYLKTGEGKEKLYEAAMKAATAYNIEGAAVLALAGDYEALNEKLSEARNKELDDVISKAETAIVANEYQFREAFDAGDSGDNINSAGQLEANFEDGGSQDDETAVMNAVNKWMSDNPNSNIIEWDGSDLQVQVPNTADGAYQAYTALSEILKTASANGADGNSEYYQGIQEMVSSLKEEAEQYEVNAEIIRSSKAEQKVNKARSVAGKSINDVSTLSDYMTLREEVFKDVTDEKERDAILAELANQEGTKEFEAAILAMTDQISRYGEGGDQNFIDNLKQAYRDATQPMLIAIANTPIIEDEDWTEFQKRVQANLLLGLQKNKITIAAEYKMDETAANNVSKVLGTLNKDLQQNRELLEQTSTSAIQYNKEIENFAKEWKSNSDAIFDATSPIKYAEALSNLSKSLGKVFDTDIDLSSYISKNKQIIADFMNGDMTQFSVIQKGIAEEVAAGYADQVQNLDELFAIIGDNTQKYGETIDGNLLDNLNTKLANNELTITAVTEILQAMGWSAEFAGGEIAKLTKIMDSSLIDQTEFKKRQKEAKKRLLDLDEEIDRYYELNKAQESLERRSNRISTVKDSAFGAEKLAYIQAENENLQKQLENNQAYEKEAQSNLKADRQTLIDKYGASFDEYGNISNYEELVKAQVDMVNSTINNDDAYDSAKEAYDQFKEDMGNYEDSLSTLEDKQIEVMETTQELRSNALASIVYTVELKVEANNRDIELLEWLQELSVDNGFAAAEKMADIDAIFGKTLNSYSTTIEAANNLYNEKYMELNQEEIDQISNWISEMQENISTLWEQRASLFENLTSEIDAWGEKLDKTLTKISNIRSTVEGYKNIIDLVGKDKLGITDEMLRQTDEIMTKNSQAQLSASNERLKAEKNTLANAQMELEKARENGDSDLIKYWEEQVKNIEDKVAETAATVQENWETALQDVADAFGNEVERIADNFSKAMSGVYGTLEEMGAAWERQEEVASRYLSSYEEIYEINKLNRQIMKSIESTDNIKSQRQLRDLMAEANQLKEADGEMSRNDLEYLQKKYDLMVAEQAFRDAQNAKTTVKLQRDSQGNFGYVYTADQSNIDQTQQKYEDSLYAYQNYANNLDKTLTKQYIDLAKKAEAEIREMATLYGEGSEQFIKEQNRIMTQFKEDSAYLETEYVNLTGRSLEINREYGAGLADTFNQTYLGRMLPDQQNFSNLFSNANNTMKQSMSSVSSALDTLNTEFDRIFGLMNTSTIGFKEKFVEQLGQAEQGTKDLRAQAEQDAKDMDKALNGEDGLVVKTGKFAEDFTKKLKPAKEELVAFVKAFNELLQKLSNPGSLKTDKIAEAIGKLQKPIQNLAIQIGTLLGKLQELYDYKPPVNENQWTVKGTTIDPGTKEKLYVLVNAKTGEEKTISSGDLKNYTTEAGEKFTQADSKNLQAGTNIIYYGEGGQFAVSQNYWEANWLKKEISGYDEDKDTEFEIIPKADGARYYSEGEVNKSNKNTAPTYNTISDTEDWDNKLGTIVSKDVWENPETGERYVLFKFKEKFGNVPERVWVPLSAVNHNNSTSYWNPTIKSLDTGGYTGSWGPDGRLAMLHQKEIVLNAHDTENFLTAVEIMRTMQDKLEANAAAAALSLANRSVSFSPTGSGNLEQNITIHAEFPAATDRHEIEEAFNTLALRASQYANRK